VTPHDSNVNKWRALQVTVTGNLVVRFAATGSQITYTAAPVGTMVPFHVDRVLATGTTATVVGLA
jgi:hypothetical protein